MEGWVAECLAFETLIGGLYLMASAVYGVSGVPHGGPKTKRRPHFECDC